MSVIKHADPTKPNTRVVGYVDRRTGYIVCLAHGQRDIESPRSPWSAVRLVDRLEPRYASTAPVICHECGAWLNDESTGYAMASTHDDHWKRRLRRARGQRVA